MSKAIPTSKRSIRKWIYKQLRTQLIQGHCFWWPMLDDQAKKKFPLTHLKIFVRRVNQRFGEANPSYWEVYIWKNARVDGWTFQDVDYKNLVNEVVRSNDFFTWINL